MYLIIASLTLVLTFILYLRRNYGRLERLGIPMVAPYVLGVGSPPLWIHQKKMVDVDVERLARLGPIWGLYQGSDPWIYIANPAMVKEICVKAFDHFQGHAYQEFFSGKAKQKYRTLDIMSGEEWRIYRPPGGAEATGADHTFSMS